jgi:hypothetical protein
MTHGRGAVKHGRSLAIALVAAAMLPCGGCGLAPHSFRKMQPTAPVVRARGVGSERGAPDAQVVKALISRLEDEDPVVRLTAGDELHQRTGRDFGFVPWSSAEERSAAIARWQTWLTGPPMPAASIQAPQRSPVPVAATPQAVRRPVRRKRRRAQAEAPAAIVPPAPPTTEAHPS